MRLHNGSGEAEDGSGSYPVPDILEDDSILRVYKGNIDERGLFGEVYLYITKGSIVVYNPKTGYTKKVDMDEVSSVRVNDYLGNGELEVETGGGCISLIRFTREYMDRFRNAANLIENLTYYKMVDESAVKRFNQKEMMKERVKTQTLKTMLTLMRMRIKATTVGIVAGMLATVLGLLPPYLMKTLIDNVLGEGNVSLLTTIVLSLIGIYAANAILNVVRSYALSYAGQHSMCDLRRHLYRHILKFQLDLLDRYEAGRVISRITDDVGRINWFLTWGIQSFLVNVFTLVAIGAILLLLNVKLALIAMIPVPFLAIGIFLFRRKARRVYHMAWRRWADVTTLLVDKIPNFPLIKAFSREDEERRTLDAKLREQVSARMNATKLSVEFFPMLGFTLSASVAIIWWLGGLEVLGGSLTLGTLTAFISYVWQFYGPMNSLISMIEPLQQVITSVERINSLLYMEPNVKEPEKAVDLNIRGHIIFDNVKFGYEPYAYVLKNINLQIKPGEKVGIVGPTGSGKTTLTKLILRFYDPNEGRILIDGVNLKNVKLSSLRRQIGLVVQDPPLFSDTIANNIRYGKPDATPEEVMAAAKVSQAHEFIMKMPLAYDSPVGHRGSKLSGGERQRIAIARAIISDPKVLILDEATSSLDAITERKVKEALDYISRGRTTIIIAHRLSTVMDTDRIIVLDKGRIVEVGSHDQLLRRGGLYKRLWNMQFREGIIEVPIGGVK